jgi:Tfp pilus assembly protein PilF
MKFLFVLFGIILLSAPIQAQSLEEAKKLYLEGRYEEAKPAFEKAIKSAPKNASYNQWYGTCLLETGEPEKAEHYLEFAASKKLPGAFGSLGKLYYNQYRFEEAEEAYEEYIDVLEKNKHEEDAAQAKPLLEKAQRAKRMLNFCEDIQIIDSLVVSKETFLNYYSLSEESGSLQYDLSGKAVIYENQLKDKRYFAKKTDEGVFRLYNQLKLLDEWSGEFPLKLATEREANDNYPYVLSDGVTIYYASTGNGSIGGYDLFVTRYNLNDDSYFTPEQLGMPFNSIYNDYMIAIDEFNNIGYFVTDRFQPEDRVIIYTFIPNAEKKIIKNNDEIDNPDYLRSRAQIQSIRDSWQSGQNYAALLQKVKQNNESSLKKEKTDFTLVINDNIVYHQLNEFESDEAKNMFTRAKSLQDEIILLQHQLDTNRLEYITGDIHKKNELKETILSSESRLETMSAEYDKMLVNIRNTEIRFLRK